MMATTRTTFTLDEALAADARRLGVNVSSAARDGVRAAVHQAMAREDRAAYERIPEAADPDWERARAWGPE